MIDISGFKKSLGGGLKSCHRDFEEKPNLRSNTVPATVAISPVGMSLSETGVNPFAAIRIT